MTKNAYFHSKTASGDKDKETEGFPEALSQNFEIQIPELKPTKTTSLDFIRNMEGRYANDLTNSLLNYDYAILKTYVGRAINAVGLDNSISFLHFISKGEHSSLTFDLMELWRVNIDYSVLQTLEEIK